MAGFKELFRNIDPDQIRNTVRRAAEAVSDATGTAIGEFRDSVDPYRNQDPSCYEKILYIEKDQYEKESFAVTDRDDDLRYIITGKSFSLKRKLTIRTADGFVIGTVEKKWTAKRSGSPETYPVDFRMTMGKEEIPMLRSGKAENWGRRYTFGDWEILRCFMGSDFHISAHGKTIADIIHQGMEGSYEIRITQQRDEVMVLMAVTAMESEYTDR